MDGVIRLRNLTIGIRSFAPLSHDEMEDDPPHGNPSGSNASHYPINPNLIMPLPFSRYPINPNHNIPATVSSIRQFTNLSILILRPKPMIGRIHLPSICQVLFPYCSINQTWSSPTNSSEQVSRFPICLHFSYCTNNIKRYHHEGIDRKCRGPLGNSGECGSGLIGVIEGHMFIIVDFPFFQTGNSGLVLGLRSEGNLNDSQRCLYHQTELS